jgi:2-methylcitrate dehydratase PrpD
MENVEMNYTEMMARYAANLKYEDIPKETIDLVKILILDFISCAYGGVQTESGRIAAEFAREFSEKGKCTVIGYGYKSAPYNAAFANAILSHSIELDDADVLAYIHTGPQTVSAALSAAEWVNASGKDFLVGVAIGSEFVNRISEATNPSLRNRGFHSTPTCGVFGAGAAAGHIMKLDEKKMVNVLGLSGAQASGLMEMYGVSMAKRFNPGPAARNGITAALFAERGFTGAETILEGERGFCKAFSDTFDLSRLTENLGKDFRISVELKPYACARPIHNAIDCGLQIRQKHPADIIDIVSLVMKRNPEWGTRYHCIKEPRTFNEAQMSLPFSVALALIRGKAFVDDYSDENIKDPEIMRLSKLMEIENDPSLPRGVSCHLTVTMKSGKTTEVQVDYPKGSSQNPMNEAERLAKFEGLSRKLLNDDQRKAIFNKINELEKVRDINEFTSLLKKN